VFGLKILDDAIYGVCLDKLLKIDRDLKYEFLFNQFHVINNEIAYDLHGEMIQDFNYSPTNQDHFLIYLKSENLFVVNIKTGNLLCNFSRFTQPLQSLIIPPTFDI
jgi:hypothetical protein